MFITHYAKVLPKKPTVLPGALASLVYGILDDHKLFTATQILVIVGRYVKASPARLEEFGGLFKTDDDLLGALKMLVDGGFLKEIVGVRLAKFVEGLP